MAQLLPVKFWRGTRAAYNKLATDGKLDYATRYTVKEENGIRSEFFGARSVNVLSGELYPVLDVVESLPETLNVGDRYLVGHDKTESGDSEYYLVEIAADLSKSSVNPLGDFAVRVKNRGGWRYQLVDGKLISFDQVIDCGTY